MEKEETHSHTPFAVHTTDFLKKKTMTKKKNAKNCIQQTNKCKRYVLGCENIVSKIEQKETNEKERARNATIKTKCMYSFLSTFFSVPFIAIAIAIVIIVILCRTFFFLLLCYCYCCCI